MDAAAGFSDHTGWAIAVILAGPVEAPRLLWRGRLALLDDALPRQVFHTAAETPVGDPPGLIALVRAGALERSRLAIEGLIATTVEHGHELTTVAVAGERRPLPEELDRVLRSHALLHAAEGALFRAALADSAADLGLRVVRVSRDTLGVQVVAATALEEATVDAHLKEIGWRAGPPWQIDHRTAALAAWLALAGGSS